MKFIKKLLFVLIFVFALTTFIACEKNEEKSDKIVITYDSQGGSSVEKTTLTVDTAKDFTLPENPTKEGYIFAGWYLDQNFKREFKSLDAVPSEITLYAKWINPNDLTNTGISFSLVFEEEYNVDLHITPQQSVSDYDYDYDYDDEDEDDLVGETDDGDYDGDDILGAEDTEPIQIKQVVTEKTTVDCAVFLGKTSKFEDLNISLIIKSEAKYNVVGIPITAGSGELKIYIKDGKLYILMPGVMVGPMTDMAISADLVKVYNDNIERVKDDIKQALEMVKSIPAEDLPEGFDLSALDRIDIDNLSIEDLLALKDLLPDNLVSELEKTEDLSIDTLFEMVKEYILPEFDDMISEEELDALKKYVKDILNILKKLLPTETKNGKTTRWEITDKQVKDVIDELAAYLKEDISEIFELVSKFSNAGLESQEPEYDSDYFEVNDNGETIYFFQPKYIDSEGVTHTYKEDLELFESDPEAEIDFHGEVIGDYFFLYENPENVYFGFGVAFDMNDDWKFVKVLARTGYNYNDNYREFILFGDMNKVYDTLTNTFITISEAYELMKDEEFRGIDYNEEYKYYKIDDYYFHENFEPFTQDEIDALPKEDYGFDFSAILEQVVDAYKDAIKNSFVIKNCYGEVKMGILLPESIKGLIEGSVDIKGEDWPTYLANDDYIKGDAKFSFNVSTSIVSMVLEFPDFSAYTDMTESLNLTVDELLTQLEEELELNADSPRQ